MKAKDFMSTKVITCNEDATLQDAAKIMWENKISILPIVDTENKLCGIITESDFVSKEVEVQHALGPIRAMMGEILDSTNIEEVYRKNKTRKVSEVMNNTPKTANQDSDLNAIVNYMSTNNLKRLPIVEDGTVVGVVTRKDLIKAFLDI